MAIEGLRVILDKEAVVPTPTADQLVVAPETVDAAFLHHVRSYVPFGRAAGAGDERDAFSITDYEKRLIEKIKANNAPKGYITADFGYGKTSTALYIWDRCRRAGLLAVPPFQLGKLDDLIHAAYGWSRYELNRTAPGLVSDLEALYTSYRERSIESDANGDAATAATLRQLQAVGRYDLTLVATDYATFFEHLAELAKRAGFAGVAVLADELQQYLDPAIRGGRGDPIAPLFNIVEALNTRRGRLPVGLVLSLLRKDFGVINDQRGDFIQRLKMDGLGLDLGAIYDKRFAGRLWHRLAEEFAFADETPLIVTPAALDALGQIAARDDLANGPRTVIAAFGWMTRRFLDAGGSVAPLTPIDLVDAFLTGDIVFDGTSKLQMVVQTQLDTPLVAGRADLRQVVKAFAAFPTDGAMEPVLRDLGRWEAAEELDRLSRGDISIMVGGGLDDRGERVPYGYTLRGLEPRSAVAQDWLTQTLREFSRNFVDASETNIARVEAGFARLLADVVFRAPDWKRVEKTERRRTDGANRSLLFEGSFPVTAKRFPERRVLVRILREGEKAERVPDDVDVTLDITLALGLDPDDQRRRLLPGAVAQAAEGQASLMLNLFHRESEDYYPDLQAALQPVVMPNRVTPLLMLSLHEYLEEKRRARQVPKEDDREVEQFYQPRLLEHSAEELLNAELGAPLNARGPRVVEELFRAVVESRYPAYKTVIRQQAWTQALQDYKLALERLDNRHERQGAVEYEATKEELARLFHRSNPALDSFMENFPDLITVEPKFRGRERSKVRFRLHPFEEHVWQLLRAGETMTVTTSGRQVAVKRAKLSLVQETGAARGYRPREIGALLDIMTRRELVEVSPQSGTIQEVAHVQLGVEDLARKIAAARARVNTLLTAVPNDPLLTTLADNLKRLQQEVSGGKKPDDATIRKLDSILRTVDRQLAQVLETTLNALRAAARGVALDDVSDPRQDYRLADPIAGDFFAPQLDVIRRKLLDEADSLRRRRDDLKRQTLAVVGQLNAEVPTDDGVIRGQQDVASLRRDAQEIEADAKGLDARGRHLATARRVLGQSIELNATLARDGAALDDPDLVASFRAQAERVQAELSSRKEAALDGADRWETALGELRNRLTARLDAARDTFAAQKARYLELLQTYAHVPPGSDALPVVFNAADPPGSWAALASVVSSLLSNRLQRMASLAAQYQVALRQLLASGDIQYQDEPGAHEELSRSLMTDLLTTSERAATLAKWVADRAVVGDDGRLIDFLKEFQDLFNHFAALGQRAESALSAVRLRQLDDPEQRVYGLVVQQLAEAGEALDVGQLLDNEELSRASPNGDVWRVLEQLYRKRRLSVQIGTNRVGEVR